jgi:UDP-N-acetylmuramoyl-L-alanyl-D-glutamate--2,6-diaminopimelate ligase
MPDLPKSLAVLLEGTPVVAARGGLDVPIGAITHDSRLAGPGVLFVAYRGVYQDVHQYIPDALARGAAACVVERPIAELVGAYDVPADAVLVQVPEARLARGLMASALYDHPSRQMAVVGITGTDGKTSTTLLLHAMLDAAERKAGMVSTVSAKIGASEVPTGLHTTTPEPEDLQAFLASMVEQGLEVAVLEVTSHGLHQRRTAGVSFDIAVITNITRNEALEYHGTFEEYREAKALLFHSLQLEPATPGVTRTAVLNAADPSFAHLSAIPAARRITYRTSGTADFHAKSIVHTPSGLAFTAVTPYGPLRVKSPLLGAYNVANILAAMAAAYALEAPAGALQAGVEAVSAIPGRMEGIDEGQPFTAIVDFAHTPNALRNALTTAHELVGPTGRVVAVFGCAGLRDPGKRAAMGRHAGELADFSYITAEDPRTEDLGQIMSAVADGVRQAGGREGTDYACVPDRFEAIRSACDGARPQDVVIVCGKGHEQSMCFGETEYEWDDRSALRAVLRGETYGRLPTAGSESDSADR